MLRVTYVAAKQELLACLAILALASCSRQSAEPVASGLPAASTGGRPAMVAEPVAGFPAPESLITQLRSASYVEANLVHLGGEYELSLPHHNVDNSSKYLWFKPSGHTGTPVSLDNLAYAIFSFHLSGYDQDAVLDMDWITQPLQPGNMLVGLADFNKNGWNWFPAPVNSQLTLSSFAHYIHAGSDIMFVAVAYSGSSIAALNHIRVGRHYDEFEDNEGNSLNLLPTVDYNGFSGSLGTDPSYSGYDGDMVDGYAFYAHRGDSINIGIEYNSVTSAVTAKLTDSNSTVLASVSGASPLLITRTFGPTETAPYFLTLTANSGFGDYQINCDYSFAPVAQVSADVWNGSAPLTVNFDATQSSDSDGSIAKYEWDWDGDGTYDFVSGTDSAVQHVYGADGAFKATLRVTDDTGNSSSSSLTISVGSVTYDEIEQNDYLYDIALLPSVPFSNYRASIGSGVGYPGYDGDKQDGYFFYPTDNQKVTFTLDYDQATAPSMELIAVDSQILNALFGSVIAPGRIALSLTAPAGTPLPYIIVASVQNSGEFSDYTLQAGSGLAPVAQLAADTTAGLAPLDVSFDASGSYDDGSIAKYEWDWDNDYLFDQDSGSLAHAVHSFAVAGVYPVQVRVTDNDGLMSTASQTVYAWLTDYDEVEPNTYESGEFAAVPSLPFSAFKGSLGSGPGYPGYTGDTLDMFEYSAAVGQTVTFSVTSNAATADMYLVIRDGDGSYEWDQSNTDSGTETVSHTMTGAEVLPMIIWLSINPGGYTDYQLSGSVS